MIDRAARDQVISAFEAYLDDRLTAFEFDDRLQAIESEDRTVNEVIHAAWFHYDDCKDHKVRLSKLEWDYFQRLLLVLGSDAELTSSASRRWSWDHGMAWLAFVAFVGLSFVVGWGWHLVGWAVPFGIVSLGINRYRRLREPVFEPRQAACTPFESFSQIRRVRSQFPGFRKRRYRSEVGDRKIRSEAEESFYRALSYGYWLVFSPLILLFQGFPSSSDQAPKVTKP